MVLVGIHLCRRLSARFVELSNLISAALPSLTAGCCAITMGYRIDHRFLKTKNIPHGYTPFCNPMVLVVVLLASGR